MGVARGLELVGPEFTSASSPTNAQADKLCEALVRASLDRTSGGRLLRASRILSRLPWQHDKERAMPCSRRPA